MCSRKVAIARLCFVLALLTQGCTPERGIQLPPRPSSVEPSRARNDAPTAITILGEDFYVSAIQHLEGPAPVTLDTGYRARLGDVELQSVEWVDTHTLRAIVPADLAPGSHVLTLTNPAAREGTLPDAFLSFSLGPPELSGRARFEPSEIQLEETARLLLEISNSGESRALAVAPSLETSGTCTLSNIKAPPAAEVASGATQIFEWLLGGVDIGQCSASLSAHGSDATSGSKVAMPPASAGPLLVRTPPLLEPLVQFHKRVTSEGDTVTLTLTVQNTGRVAVDALTPAASLQPTGLLVGLTQPTPRIVGIGETSEFSWTFRAVAAGQVRAVISASGVDAVSGLPVTLAPMATQPLEIVHRASLALTVSAPAKVSVGQRFTVRFDVENSGEATAVGASMVAPRLIGTGGADLETAPAARDIASGQMEHLAFDYTATRSGELIFVGSVAATDEMSDVSVGCTGQSDAVVVQTPASLVITSFASPRRISRGQSFTATMVVENVGEATATVASPVPLVPTSSSSGGAQITTASSAAPTAIAGKSTTTFTWQYQETGSSPGNFSLSAGVQAHDSNSGASVSADPATTPVTLVEAPASIVVKSLTLPKHIARGSPFQVRMEVANTGQAAATGVVPVPAAPTMSATGGASAATSSSPASVDVPGGGTATFSWAYTENGSASGALRFSVAAHGTDANLAAAVSSPVVSSAVAQVLKPASLTVSSFSLPTIVVDGQPFTALMVVRNDGEATATAVNAVPDPPTVIATGSASASALATGPTAIPGGASHTYFWEYTPVGTGTLALRAALTATDDLTGATVTAAAQTTPASTLQAPSDLRVLSFGAPARVNRGQTFSVSMQLKNVGGSALNGVVVAPSPPAVIALGGTGASSASALSPVALASGEARTLTWAFVENGSAAGTLQFTAGASGTDAVSGAPVTAVASTTSVVSVQRPASLSVTSFTIPERISRGQIFAATLVVTNTGEARANAVLPAAPVVTASGGAAAATASSPTAASIAGGASATFAWTYVENGSAAGDLSLTASVSGVDANDASILSAGASSNAAAVQQPASLSIAAFAQPQNLSRGQSFTLQLDVTNTGQATATGVAPTVNPPTVSATGGAAATSASEPGAVDLPGGATAHFVWSWLETGSAPGTLSFSTSVTGTDANSTAALSAGPRQSAAAAVQEPAALAITSFSIPSTLSRGQAFAAQIQVTNTGQATAVNVRPSPATPTVSATGSAAATSISSVASESIAGGASHTFTFTFQETGTGTGTLSLSSAVAGEDSNSGAAISSGSRPSNSATVQMPAVLSGSLAVPAWVDSNSNFPVTMTVTNTGQAKANAVAPSALALNGTAGLSLVSGPSPVTQTVDGGSSTTFSWTYLANTEGTVQLAGSASGSDSNSSQTVATGNIVSNTGAVQDVQTVASNPFGDSTAFAFVFEYSGLVYLGPNKSGGGALRMLPDGSSPQSISFGFSKDTTGNTSANKAAPPYASIGATGCAKDTLQCGPDNEDGRGLFAATTVLGTPWLVLGGARTAKDLDYIYMTPDTGGTLTFRYVDLSKVMGGATEGFSSLYGFRDRIYMGFPDSGGARPYLLTLFATPQAPGLDTLAGTHVLNLDADKMPNMSTASVAMIDSITGFHDRLYIANSGNWMRSTVNTPDAYGSTPAHWAVCAPTAAAYTSKASRTSLKTADIEPSDKSVPQMAEYGGRLYVGRNTVAGPQLWACTPALSGTAADCDPGDWSLVAPNSSGDTALTQFNNASNTSISLVVATAGSLYIGFDNAANGVVLFRTSAPTPLARGDFRGFSACSAADHPGSCEGLGRNGLGNATSNTRIFDAIGLTFSERSYVYLVAGNGSSGVTVHRASP